MLLLYNFCRILYLRLQCLPQDLQQDTLFPMCTSLLSTSQFEGSV